jgi:hypothetical protein
MRGAARTLQAEPARVPWWWLRPVWVGAVATAAALLLFLMLRPTTPVAPFAVYLTALRGEELVQTVPPGAPLELHPDLTGLPSTASSLEIVDAKGRAVWKGAISPAVVTAPALRAGTYFLRVYGASGELFREFAIHAVKTPAASTAPR